MYVSRDEYGRYLPGVVTASVKEREVLVLRSVLKALDIKGIEVWNYQSGGTLFAAKGNYAKGDVRQFMNADFYRYLLSEICEYAEDGTVKGLPAELCEDFYALCKIREVDFREYSGKPAPGEVEYVTTVSDGNGAVYDFLTFPTRAKAEKYCEGCGWQVMDEACNVWRLDIEARKVSLDSKLASAKQKSELSVGKDLPQQDFVKE